MKKRVLIPIIIAIVIGLLAGGYFLDIGGVKTAIDQKIAERAQLGPAQKLDKSLTNKLKQENGILDGRIYTQDNMAFGAVVVKSDINEQDAKSLAQKYANELKTKYKDKKVNVQVVTSDNRNLANITID